MKAHLFDEYPTMKEAKLPLPRKHELLFRCPECGGNELTEVLALCKHITVYDDGDWIWEPTSCDWEGQTLSFQCAQCRYTLKNEFDKEVQTNSELVNWLMTSCKGENV